MNVPAWKRAWIDQLAAGSTVVATARGPVEMAEIGAGPPVLVLHGRPGGYDQGLLIARGIGEARAHWVVVSRPGYIRTPLATGRTPAEQADAYAALLDAQGIAGAAVLALSGGGPSALQFARRHPGRCRGLVLVSTVTRRKTLAQRPLGQKLFDGVIGGSDLMGRLALGLLGPIAGPAGRQGLATVLVLPETLRGAGRRNDLEQFAALDDRPPAGITAPTLIVHGTADRIVLFAHAEAAAAAIPGARLVPIPGGGHSTLFRDAARVVPEIAGFLGGLPASD